MKFKVFLLLNFFFEQFVEEHRLISFPPLNLLNYIHRDPIFVEFLSPTFLFNISQPTSKPFGPFDDFIIPY